MKTKQIKTCIYCDRDVHCRKMCAGHYRRWYQGARNADLSRPIGNYGNEKKPKCPCGQPSKTRNLCNTCYQKLRREEYAAFQKEIIDYSQEKGWTLYWQHISKTPMILVKKRKMMFMYMRQTDSPTIAEYNLLEDLSTCGVVTLICCPKNGQFIKKVLNGK